MCGDLFLLDPADLPLRLRPISFLHEPGARMTVVILGNLPQINLKRIGSPSVDKPPLNPSVA